MQIQAALDLFVGQLEADGRSSHTIGQYRRHVRALAAWLASSGRSDDLSALRHQDVATFFGAPDARTAAGTTRAKRSSSMNAMRTSIRCFFSHLHAAGHVGANAAGLLKRARSSPPPPKAMHPEEEQKLLAYLAGAPGDAARRDEALVRLMLGAGLRIGAALGLDIEDVDLERAEVHVRKDKNDRSETVLLPMELVEHLRGFIGSRRSGALFATGDGERVSTRQAQRRFSEAVKGAGIERRLSPHSLRHTFASKLLRQTQNLELVRRALRHKSVSSTIVYARLDDADVRAALATR